MKAIKPFIVLVIMGISLTNCTKKETDPESEMMDSSEINANLPNCLNDLLETMPNLAISTQEINGELHYWVSTTHIIDDDEDIVNPTCEKQCYVGGWIHPDCFDEYDSGAWVSIHP